MVLCIGSKVTEIFADLVRMISFRSIQKSQFSQLNESKGWVQKKKRQIIHFFWISVLPPPPLIPVGRG